MKTLIFLPIFLLLTGCAPLLYKIYDSYFLAPYDNVEYSLTNKIRTMAEKAEELCTNKLIMDNEVDQMYFVAKELKNFSQHLPDNRDTIKLTTNLYDLVKGARDHYLNNKEVSMVYCKAKLKQIYSNAETIQKVVGAKPR